MPYLTPVEGEVITALVTIGIGILVERWFVSRSSIIANVFAWIVILFTIDIDETILGIMILWLLFGFVLVMSRGNGRVKQLFGSKVFGSLALILGLNQWGDIGLETIPILIIWMITAGIVFLLGRRYNAR